MAKGKTDLTQIAQLGAFLRGETEESRRVAELRKHLCYCDHPIVDHVGRICSHLGCQCR